MLELRQGNGGDDHELVSHARTARNDGRSSFQVFVRHTGRLDSRDEEYEAARLADLVEAAGWTLENVGHAAERENDWAYGVQTTTVVGTIYTFSAPTP
jgi:hypothetical protein